MAALKQIHPGNKQNVTKLLKHHRFLVLLLKRSTFATSVTFTAKKGNLLINLLY